MKARRLDRRRQLADEIRTAWKAWTRQACRALRTDTSTYRYKGRRSDQTGLSDVFARLPRPWCATAIGASMCCSGGGLAVKKGQPAQAIGVSSGRHTTKIQALSDDQGLPCAFHLTGGHAADCRASKVLLELLPPDTLLYA